MADDMDKASFDFWTALLGEDGARELAQSFLSMGAEARAELGLSGPDPLRDLARYVGVLPDPPPRSVSTEVRLTPAARPRGIVLN